MRTVSTFGACPIIKRDMRVTAGGVSTSRHLLKGPWQAPAFAHDLLQRYGHHRVRSRLSDFVFWRWSPSITLSSFAHHFHTTLWPRLTLTVLGPSQEGMLDRPSFGARKIDWIEQVQRRLSRVFVQDQVTRENTEQLVRRLFTRTERVDTVSRLDGPSTSPNPDYPSQAEPGSAPMPLVQPVPRILRLPASVEVPSVDGAGSPQRAASHPSAPAPMAGRPTGEWGGVNLNTLTDQVVRVIDRRVTAYRERTGKV